MTRIKQIILMSLLALAGIVLLGFAIDRQHDRACESFEVDFIGNSSLEFVRDQEVKQSIRDKGSAIIGQPMNEILTKEIEDDLRNDPFIKSATVYKTIDLGVQIVIEQRVPVFRFISDRGISGYVDTDGYYMPMRKGYSPKMVPVTGNLPVPIGAFEGANVKDDSLMTAMWEMMKTVSADDFWKSQFVQIDISPSGEVTAIPRVGNHQIIFGSAMNHDAKLDRLKAFYEKGVAQTNWNIYESINVKFEDQVVCKKRQYN